MAVPAFKQHIELDSSLRNGKPHISGTRITVQDVAIWHERMGLSVDEIADQYNLSLSQIYSALSYYFDNREKIDQTILEGEVFVEQIRKGTPSVLEKKLNNLRSE